MIESSIGTTADNGVMALIGIGKNEKKYYYYKCFNNQEIAIDFVAKLYAQGGIPADEINSNKWIESEINK
ncbi:MAG: hypothetical protein HRT42_14155 [Campylobacteraceae bacterium]|nr:hypothetical protein [Campylobacteraceae bacterium]